MQKYISNYQEMFKGIVAMRGNANENIAYQRRYFKYQILYTIRHQKRKLMTKYECMSVRPKITLH